MRSSTNRRMEIKRKRSLVKELAEVLEQEKKKEQFAERIKKKNLDCQGPTDLKGKICFQG